MEYLKGFTHPTTAKCKEMSFLQKKKKKKKTAIGNIRRDHLVSRSCSILFKGHNNNNNNNNNNNSFSVTVIAF